MKNERVHDLSVMEYDEAFDALRHMADEAGVEVVDMGIAKGWMTAGVVFVRNYTQEKKETFGVRAIGFFYGINDVDGNRTENADSSDEYDCTEVYVYDADDKESISMGFNDLKSAEAEEIVWMNGGGVVNE